MRRRHREQLRGWASGAVSATLGVAYMIAVAGLPLPASHIRSAERFPCEHCGCGCTAASCWQDCCCFTLPQRLRWAAQAGVQPPTFVQRALRVKVEQETAAAKSLPACCRSRGRQLCSEAPDRRGGALACTLNDALDRDRQVEAAKAVFGWRVLRCQGKTSLWVATAPPSMTPQRTDLLPNSLHQWLSPTSNESASSQSHRPPVPPPQSLHSRSFA